MVRQISGEKIILGEQNYKQNNQITAVSADQFDLF
jgi:hypothetical protein